MAVLVVAASLGALAGTGVAVGVGTDTARSCSDESIPVRVGSVVHRMHARVCLPEGRPAATQILVHGATYSSRYWDMRTQVGRYSYVDEATAAGFATVAIDRLGTGRSSRPLSVAVTSAAQSAALRQVAARVRGGEFVGVRARVVLVGHSLGSLAVVAAQRRWHVVDAIVLTGFSHGLSPTATAELFAGRLWPATADPKFGLGVDPGYLTTRPRQRYDAFHRPGDVDPGVVREDEQHKDVVSTVDIAGTLLDGFSTRTARDIEVPVLVAVGEKDSFFCSDRMVRCANADSLRASERRVFAGSSRVDAYIQPASGHNLQLARGGDAGTRHVSAWIRDRVRESAGDAR